MPDPGDKSLLRRQLRRRRNAIPLLQRQQAARDLLAHASAIPGWSDCRKLGGYIAADGEIDPLPLIQLFRKNNGETFLPVIQPGNQLAFAAWTPGDALRPNQYGIPEPSAARLHSAQALDAILVPLVGWDKRGCRLGMGGGFYDRSLAGVETTLKIGLAYSAQEIDELPAAPWDIPLDFVLTETALHHCRGGD